MSWVFPKRMFSSDHRSLFCYSFKLSLCKKKKKKRLFSYLKLLSFQSEVFPNENSSHTLTLFFVRAKSSQKKKFLVVPNHPLFHLSEFFVKKRFFSYHSPFSSLGEVLAKTFFSYIKTFSFLSEVFAKRWFLSYHSFLSLLSEVFEKIYFFFLIK